MQQGQYDDLDVTSLVQETWRGLLAMEICKRGLRRNSEAKRQLHRYSKKFLTSISV